jgi:hypothetical protein
MRSVDMETAPFTLQSTSIRPAMESYAYWGRWILGVLVREGIIAALSSPAGRVGSGGEGAVVSLAPPYQECVS